MMGGDQDCSSKGIMGTHVTGEETYLLIVVGFINSIIPIVIVLFYAIIF